MSELNKSANHVTKTSEKKRVNKDCRYLVVFLISRDKNFILLLACFGLIFTKALSPSFFSHYVTFSP